MNEVSPEQDILYEYHHELKENEHFLGTFNDIAASFPDADPQVLQGVFENRLE